MFHFRVTQMLIREFQDLLDSYAGVSGFRCDYKKATIKAIGVTFNPCARRLRVHKAIIYLL